MFRIYYKGESINDPEWILYLRSDEENQAWEYWDACSNKHPYSKIRMTKETVIKEA